jgi:hypothetical protein
MIIRVKGNNKWIKDNVIKRSNAENNRVYRKRNGG